MKPSTIREILTFLALMPLRFSDLRAQPHPVVLASDASDAGGGLVAACGLTPVKATVMAGGELMSAVDTSFTRVCRC